MSGNREIPERAHKILNFAFQPFNGFGISENELATVQLFMKKIKFIKRAADKRHIFLRTLKTNSLSHEEANNLSKFKMRKKNGS